MRHAGFAQSHGARDYGLDAPDQIDVFRIERSLAFERRLFERFKMLVHLALTEPRDGLLLVAIDMHDVLRRDLQLRKFPSGFLRHLLELRHHSTQRLLRHRRGNPAVAGQSSALKMGRIIAPEIDRQFVLLRLREQLDILEFVVFALERRLTLREQEPQRAHAFLDHVAAMNSARGIERLELLPVGADPEPDFRTAIAEMVERDDLLGGDHNVAPHRQDENAGAETKRTGMSGEIRVRNHWLPETP